MRWTMGRVKEKETTFEIEQSIIFGSLDGAKESTNIDLSISSHCMTLGNLLCYSIYW